MKTENWQNLGKAERMMVEMDVWSVSEDRKWSEVLYGRGRLGMWYVRMEMIGCQLVQMWRLLGTSIGVWRLWRWWGRRVGAGVGSRGLAKSLHRTYPSLHPFRVVHWVPEQLNIKAVTEACKLIDGCSLELCSATKSVVSYGICHGNKVNSTAWLYRMTLPWEWDSTIYRNLDGLKLNWTAKNYPMTCNNCGQLREMVTGNTSRQVAPLESGT